MIQQKSLSTSAASFLYLDFIIAIKCCNIKIYTVPLFLYNQVERNHNLVLPDSGAMSNATIKKYHHAYNHCSCAVQSAEELCSNRISELSVSKRYPVNFLAC